MTYEVKLQEVQPRQAVALRFQTDIPGIGQLFGPALGRLFGHIGRQGVECTGAPLALYHRVDEAGVDMEVAVPVAEPVEEEQGPQGIHVIDLPAGPAIMTVHVGPYEECGLAYEALDNWMHEKGREPSGPGWEIYLTDPNQEPDPRKWVTEIYQPVK